MIRYIIETFPDSNSFKKYYKRIRRARNLRNRKKYIPEYLKNNNFEVELNYKLWVTKGARFKASERCEELDARYNRIVGWVSSYLIIFSVLNLCKIPFFTIPDNCSTFISISLSILILVFSQFAYAKNYSVQSKNYHECALEIAKLYNDLRLLKASAEDHIQEINRIKDEYEKILDKYINHLPIDLIMFKLDKKEYFNISLYSAVFNHIRRFLLVRSAYYFCVFILPILYCLICLINLKSLLQ
ncbi:MAG: SLATT domain-containing protein [Bacteroidota bacterium]|uniref:SLATT domain-containing protein n=1 Tax=Macellibacteroides fermentans TaxID=879969 RepID=UPI0028901AF7|nr:SLATT domain-containing protein [Bacteroidota bacterium]HML71761.1 SLATT domain-containing protein [Macellibacteroides fermentans]